MKIIFILTFWTILFSILTFKGAFGADQNDPQKEHLHQSFLEIQKQAESEIDYAVLPATPKKIKWVEGMLHGSEVFLAQSENSDHYTQYFLIEKTKDGAHLWDLRLDSLPSVVDRWSRYGFVQDPKLQACHLDLYVNGDANAEGAVRDYFQFIPGKGVQPVLSCPEQDSHVNADSEELALGQNFQDEDSVIISERNGILKVRSKLELGYASYDPDPKVAAKESSDKLIVFVNEFVWDGSQWVFKPGATQRK